MNQMLSPSGLSVVAPAFLLRVSVCIQVSLTVCVGVCVCFCACEIMICPRSECKNLF